MKRIYTKHGMTGTKIHEVWKEMLRRCKDKNIKSASYKKNGISVCSDWKSAKSFIDWALSNGYAEGLQIDRRDNKLGYSPSNCRFVTPKENANNKENTVYLEFKGERKNLNDWSISTGINKYTLYTRLSRGWSIDRVLTKKVQEK